MRIILPLILLCSCGGTRPPTQVQLQSLGDAAPRLPAPEAGVYATHLTAPSDPLVSTVLGDIPWEESLSGAAGALGVELAGGRPTDAWVIRWAALRAGYPFPIDEFSYERVAEGAVSQSILEILQQTAQPHDHAGLVRVRGGQGDYWVGLVSHPRIELQPVPRALPLGGELELVCTSSDVLQLSLVSPSGHLELSDLRQGRSIALDEEGEHWVEIRDSVGVAAAFSVYVGEMDDLTAPLPQTTHIAADPYSLELDTWDLLDEVRAFYGWETPAEDPILGPVARAHLDDHMGYEGPASGAFRGEPGSCRASMSCGLVVGDGVEACFHQWLVDPSARAALVDPRCDVAGVATDERDDRVWVQLELGQE